MVVEMLYWGLFEGSCRDTGLSRGQNGGFIGIILGPAQGVFYKGHIAIQAIQKLYRRPHMFHTEGNKGNEENREFEVPGPFFHLLLADE